MRLVRTVVVVTVLLLLLAGAVCGCTSGVGHLEQTDIQGRVHVVLDGAPADVVVLVFSSPDCPIANAVAPEIERLHRQATDGGARFSLVHVSDGLTPARARAHAKAYGITSEILLDRGRSLAKKLNATVTPEIVVMRFDDEGEMQVVYQGLINDLYADLGSRRHEATEHFAREGIAAALLGDDVTPAYRVPIGCTIERAP